MKLSFDKEMDEALRRHARRAGSSAPTAQDGAHMDADEVSAYAENALPAATRLRYAAHLADCEHCRRLVVAGTLAANVAGALEQQAAAQSEPARAASASWRGWLAALFSARALRYTAPALALVLVGAVAFIALRQNQAPESANLVAEQRRGDAQLPPGDAPSAPAPAEPAASSPATTETTELAQRESAAQAAANTAPDNRAATTTAAPPTDELIARRVAEARTDANAQSVPQATPAPSIANEAVPVAAAPARQRAESEMSAPAEAANSNSAVARTSAASQPARARDSELATQSREAARLSTPPPPSAAAPGGAGGGAGTTADSAAGPEERARRSRGSANRAASPRAQAQREEEQARSETAEIRSVGGRSFRRQGNVWVDTAYRSSLNIIGMARNSEQYRALVADEPALGRIVQQLGGEVVIVWRGRAYRIR